MKNKKATKEYRFADIGRVSGNRETLHSNSKLPRITIWLFSIFFVVLFLWMYYAKIDKLIRGEGKVVPSLDMQYIQSYDGGIISEIFAKEGSSIKKDDPIVRIDDEDFKSKYFGGKIDIYALSAKKIRLEAESNSSEFILPETKDSKLLKRLLSEKQLFLIKKETLQKKIDILKEKVSQKKSELKTLLLDIANLKDTKALTQESVNISKRMLEHKVLSKLKYNENLQKLYRITADIQSKESSIPRVESEIISLDKEIRHLKAAYQSEAREELERVTAELDKLLETKNIDKSRIKRATILSPVDGVVKKMHYNTIGGVVKPGGVIAEIVPSTKHLIIDTKVLPSDIAFIRIGQDAVVRFSAYDFATYGSLKGKVVSISADTIMDEITKRHYYTVKIKTEKSYLGASASQYPIKVGMIATVDIVNGSQSIIDYIINPVSRAVTNIQSNR